MNEKAPTELVLPLMLACPNCWRGGSHLYEELIGRNEWAEVECLSCHEPFEISEAIDEMFAKGQGDGYRLWVGSHTTSHMVECRKGETTLVDIHGVFERVHQTMWATSGEWLAGGISVRYLPQGRLMVAVARGKTELPSAFLSVLVTTIGDMPGASPLELWRELMLEAVVSSTRSRRLAPILAVAAVDLFLEQSLGREVRPGRPDSWSFLAEERTGRELRLMPGINYEKLRQAVQIRNDLAHGKELRIPAELAEAEPAWEERTDPSPDVGYSAPSSVFCLRHCLSAIRAMRRELRLETRYLGPDGLQHG